MEEVGHPLEVALPDAIVLGHHPRRFLVHGIHQRDHQAVHRLAQRGRSRDHVGVQACGRFGNDGREKIGDPLGEIRGVAPDLEQEMPAAKSPRDPLPIFGGERASAGQLAEEPLARRDAADEPQKMEQLDFFATQSLSEARATFGALQELLDARHHGAAVVASRSQVVTLDREQMLEENFLREEVVECPLHAGAQRVAGIAKSSCREVSIASGDSRSITL